jgi:hypothetical protein
MVSFILFNIFDFRPFLFVKKKPTTLIVSVGEITSYTSLGLLLLMLEKSWTISSTLSGVSAVHERLGGCFACSL